MLFQSGPRKSATLSTFWTKLLKLGNRTKQRPYENFLLGFVLGLLSPTAAQKTDPFLLHLSFVCFLGSHQAASALNVCLSVTGAFLALLHVSASVYECGPPTRECTRSDVVITFIWLLLVVHWLAWLSILFDIKVYSCLNYFCKVNS